MSHSREPCQEPLSSLKLLDLSRLSKFDRHRSNHCRFWVMPLRPAPRHRPSKELDDVFSTLYEELRSLSKSALYRESPRHTLQPTALAHEAYLRLSQRDAAQWETRTHFLKTAAAVIRCILVDHARNKKCIKRGRGWEQTSLGEAFAPTVGGWDMLDLDEALNKLESLNDRHAQVIQLRFFGGLENGEIAGVLGISTRTVNNDWRVARAWLRARLGHETDGLPSP